jgi:hypothetical protein
VLSIGERILASANSPPRTWWMLVPPILTSAPKGKGRRRLDPGRGGREEDARADERSAMAKGWHGVDSELRQCLSELKTSDAPVIRQVLSQKSMR